MKKFLVLALILGACAHAAEPSREIAPANGWAAMDGGTRGGADAAEEHVYTVSDVAALRDALKEAGNSPKIIRIKGVIDTTAGKPFEDKQDQAARGEIRLPPHTTLIGITPDAGFVNANLVLKGTENVILRNLTIEAPWDEYPQWDPKDGPSGHWNSEYDAITIDAARHVWIDHVAISDGRRTDDQNGMIEGHEVQHHDGAIDIKNMSDFITISYSVFRLHDKSFLIGHSDKNSRDAGHLTVTFHHNLFENLTQRAPRVRYGQVHLYNNHYVGDRKHPVYPLSYSQGVGVEASLISENNVFEIARGSKGACDVVRSFGGTRYQDAGSLLNDNPLDLSAGCKGDKGKIVQFEPAGWKPPYSYTLLPAEQVAAKVKAEAGPR